MAAAGKSGRRAGALAAVGALAVLAPRPLCTPFLAPFGLGAGPAAREASPQQFAQWARPTSPQTESSPFAFGVPLGAITFCAAALLAIGSPRPSFADESKGLLSLGTVDYDEEQATLRKSTKFIKTRQAEVLTDAAKNAEKRAADKEKEAAQKERARKLLQDLDAKRKAEKKAEEEKYKKRQAQREQILAELEKKKAAGGASAKAEGLFAQFLKEKEAKEVATKEAEAKQDATRAKILSDLDQRKKDAKKAAEEAEAIALKIEQLAKNAREAAAAAKQQAENIK